MDEEDYFDDDGLDDLQEEDFRALEEAAIRSAQFQQQQEQKQQQEQYADMQPEVQEQKQKYYIPRGSQAQRFQQQPQLQQSRKGRPYAQQYKLKSYENQPYKNPLLQLQQQQSQPKQRLQRHHNQWRSPQPWSKQHPPIQQDYELVHEELKSDVETLPTIQLNSDVPDKVTENHQSSDYGLDDAPEVWQSISQVLYEQERAQGMIGGEFQFVGNGMGNGMEDAQEQPQEQVMMGNDEVQEYDPNCPDYDANKGVVLEGHQDSMMVEAQPIDQEPMEGQEYYQEGYQNQLQGEYQEQLQGGYISAAQIQAMQAMQAMLAELQEDRERLAQELKEARDSLLSKSGEVSIVRNNLAKSAREHERIIASLNKLHSEEREKHHLEMESMKAESERMRTETLFLKKEIEEAVKLAKRFESTQKRQSSMTLEHRDTNIGAPSMAVNSPITTPKKNKGFAHRDGFEDDEIMYISPSKKTRTPTRAGAKRKRSQNDSPVGVLPMSTGQPRKMPMVEKQVQVMDEFILEKLSLRDDRFDFLKAVIAHRVPGSKDQNVEALGRYRFPSSPETTLSSFFLDKVTYLQATAAKSEFCSGVCRILLSIWSRCLQENFYSALSLILDLLLFGIRWDQATTADKILDETVDLVQKTVDINAIPTIKKNWAAVENDVDVGLCLKVLECVALGVMCDDQHARRLWKLTRSDFPLIMLNLNQPLSHIKLMASILCTSILPESFGPLVSNELEQRVHEGNLLEAASRVLVDVPTPPPISEQQQYSCNEILALREEILQLLGAVVGVDIGIAAIAKHRNALPRLVRRIAEELEEVYDWRSGADNSVQFINIAVRLLHGIITTHPAESATKLAGAMSHKHLVAMTRLAFSEGSVMEAGIEEDVVDCAYSLLESMVTPNEAEMLWALFHP